MTASTFEQNVSSLVKQWFGFQFEVEGWTLSEILCHPYHEDGYPQKVYAYHKSFSMPIIFYKFGSSIDPISGEENGDGNAQCVLEGEIKYDGGYQFWWKYKGA
ncbi:hypothetical protein OSB04_010673 [Centaurea solstitialis]|uniref:Uncharacterized protein n=1 Tax=Centaurea solstitialis TaxID=347529 RepID=A0AA38T9Q6_9ASTR|nr:hypothetical protein OSB04_010673 [Centaurea solstitialis]